MDALDVVGKSALGGVRVASHYVGGAAAALADSAIMLARAPVRLGEGIANDLTGNAQSSMRPIAKACAFASAQVYLKKEERRSWNLKPDNTLHFQVDESLQCDEVGTFLVNDDCVIVAFRGTTTLSHIFLQDVLIYAGIGSVEVTNFDCYMDWVAEKYAGRAIVVTGHSLGGARAMWAACVSDRKHLVDKCFAFNPGQGPFHHNDAEVLTLQGHLRDNNDVVRFIEWLSLADEPKCVVYHIWGDVFSAFSSGGRNVVVHTFTNQELIPHSMCNFLPQSWYDACGINPTVAEMVGLSKR